MRLAQCRADARIFFFNDTATTEIYTLSLHDALPILDEAGLASDRVSSVPTGIDLARYCPGDRAAARSLLALPQDRFLVGIFATPCSLKRHRFLVDSVAAMPGASAQGGVMLALMGYIP